VGFYSGDITKLTEDLALLKPTIMLSVPRLLNRIHDRIVYKISQLEGMSKNMADHGISSKLQALESGGSYTNYLYDKAVFGHFKEYLGGRVRLLLTGSAPI